MKFWPKLWPNSSDEPFLKSGSQPQGRTRFLIHSQSIL